MDAQTKDSASFVFKGTVRRVRAANVKAVTDTKRTVVVRVDEIVRGPEALVDHAGKDVTVKLAKGERATKGQQVVFYTDGWIFGENLAVQSLGHESVVAARGLIAAAAERIDPVSAGEHHQIRQYALAANLVITGKVIAVGEAQEPAGDSTGFQPMSEHEPFWNEAVIEVEKVHKGRTRKKRLVVRFPASEDAHWSAAPKFQVGYEGIFMLHADRISKTRDFGKVAAALDSEESYTCLEPVGFQPAENLNECDTAVRAAAE